MNRRTPDEVADADHVSAGGPPAAAGRGLARLRRYRTPHVAGQFALLIVWLVVVISTVARHEFWRDEVRALSLARSAGSPLDLFRVLGHDGHPVLWYALLYIGNLMTGSRFVLPVVSVLVALAAVTVFLLRAPFPLWFKALFVFSALPIYQYSVMARNYGISMLLLFVFAALYPRRQQHPLLVGLTLALLANTNAHSVLFALLLTGVWLWDAFSDRAFRSQPRMRLRLYGGIGLVVAGVLLSAALVIPPAESTLTGARNVGAGDVAASLLATALRPADRYRALIPDISGPVDQALPYLAAAGLLVSPPLFVAAVAGVIGLGVFFDVIYPGYYRHQGLILVFLLALYWLAFQRARLPDVPRRARLVLWGGVWLAWVPLLVLGIIDGQRLVRYDWREELSSTHAVGSFLRESETFRHAIIVPEPDYFIEALPYYADNLIYFPREARFGTAVSWTHRAVHLSLAQLLETSRQLKQNSGRPVIIALGHFEIEHDESLERGLAYGRRFTWTEEDLLQLERATQLVGEFASGTGDERFLLYSIR
jgi:hypothetical protein